MGDKWRFFGKKCTNQRNFYYICALSVLLHAVIVDENKPKQPITILLTKFTNTMKIKQLLLAAAAMVFAVACNEPVEPVEPTPTPTHDTWSIVGTNNEWDAAGAEALEFADGYYFAKGVEFGEGGQFKFVKDNSWTVCRGYKGDKPVRANYYYSVVQADGDGNIVLEAAGTYDIYLNEATDKFYLMEAGKAPAEAQDSETIVVEPTCAATAIIADEYDVTVGANEVTFTFSITTANAVEAAYMYRATEYVDETYTAEYIFTDGFPLQAGDDEWCGLNKENFKVDIWCNFETEYTFFLVVKDAEGLTKMVTKTVTAPEGPVKYEDWEASAEAVIDTEWNESLVVFTSAEFKLKVFTNCVIETNMTYDISDEENPSTPCITDAILETSDGKAISYLTSGFLGIYDSMWDGKYTEFRGSGVDADGKNVVVYVSCPGSLEGLGGGAGTMDFQVASAKFYHSEGNEWDIPVDAKRYILEVYSTDGVQAVFTIDNYYALEEFGDTVPFCNGTFMKYDPEYPDPYINLEQSWMTMHQITDLTFVMVTSAMPGTDENYIQAMFSAVSYMGDGTPTTVTISTPTPIAMYGSGEDVDPVYPTLTEALEINWDGTHTVFFGVIDQHDGVNVCQIAFSTLGGGGWDTPATLSDCLNLGIYAESGATLPVGTFEISETPEYGKAAAGQVWDMSEGMYPGGVWCPNLTTTCAFLGMGTEYLPPYQLPDVQAGGMFTDVVADDLYIAPIVSGTITITKGEYSEDFGAYLYDFTVDGADAKGNKVTANIVNIPVWEE